MALFLCLMTYSTIFVAHQNLMSLMCLVQVSFCLLFAAEIAGLSRLNIKHVIRSLFVILAIQVLWGILQMANIDPFFHLSGSPHIADTVGFSGSHNQYGLSLAALSTTAFFIFPYLLPLVFIAIIFSKTFSALIAFCVCIGFLCFQKLKINPLVFVVIFLLMGTTFLSVVHKNIQHKISERQKLWELSVKQVVTGKATMTIGKQVRKIITCNPLTGFGFGSFMSISPYTQDCKVYGLCDGQVNNNHYEHAHNDYVEAFFDMGKLSVIFMFLVFIEMLYLFHTSDKNEILLVGVAGLIAYAVCAIAIYTVHTAVGGFFLSVFIGIFYAGVKDGKTREQ